MDPNKYSVLGDAIEQGFEKAGNGKGLKDFDVAPFVTVAMNDDLDAAFDALRPWLALYIGGMGAKNKNFYHGYATRLGYGDAADQIQDLYLNGKKSEAEALVPNELLDEVSLVGPRERIIERLGPWKEAGKRGEVGSMLLGVQDPVVLELLANRAHARRARGRRVDPPCFDGAPLLLLPKTAAALFISMGSPSGVPVPCASK